LVLLVEVVGGAGLIFGAGALIYIAWPDREMEADFEELQKELDACLAEFRPSSRRPPR
jgi:hypothetical protein